MNNSPSILIIIATFNRPQSLLVALRSIDSQDYSNFTILISDNSTSTDTEKELKVIKIRHKYKYVHRNPQPNGIAHFNKILEEIPSDYDYFMICHDDDTLREGAISSIAKLAEQNPSCVAIFSNGFRVRENGEVIGKFKKPEGNSIIFSKKEIALKYIKGEGLPFPAILYKTKTSGIYFDPSKGGKYCDTAHSVELLNIGPIMWATNNYVINYTVSDKQDSRDINPKERRMLLNYLVGVCGFDYHLSDLIKESRINDIYSYYCLNGKVFGYKVLFFFFVNCRFKLLLKSILKNVLKTVLLLNGNCLFNNNIMI